MKFSGLIADKDGEASLTKIAALVFHVSTASAFFAQEVLGRDFNENRWWVYGGFAVGHASLYKLAAVYQDVKNRKTDADATAPMIRRETTVKTTQEPAT